MEFLGLGFCLLPDVLYELLKADARIPGGMNMAAIGADFLFFYN